ncbi:MAG: glycoside hydrolase family 2 [Chloroflexi bacterium]|nr:glycoside hydrolase family 2 [Chloroflexota bacterium]
MDTRLSEVLAGKTGSYILPFFWQHGESEAILREYMAAIHASGINEVCVESRPHPDFHGPQWWHDMDIIMDEARQRGMRVWVLDDSHFPTGYANGAFKTAAPELCIQFLSFNMVDVVGPTPQVQLDIERMSHVPPENPMMRAMPRRYEKRVFDDDQRIAVVAYRIAEGDKLSEAIDLTDKVVDGQILWDVPAGYWRVFVAYLTRNAGTVNTVMNIIDRDSVRVLIDAVYEQEWEHYQADFGKTFAGFFSDEPCFHNAPGFGRDTRIGRVENPLPWNKDVPAMLAERLGADWALQLPYLWQTAEDADRSARVRHAYMDTITLLVRDNFSNQLGEWCAAHGVEYIGHAVEDNNSSSHLGSSLGHQFRAVDGMHMAGIDEVIWQIMYGGENSLHRGGHFVNADGNFYHFVLSKLSSSHAHINPKKKGRALCEIWGASGWSLGVRGMMYTANHLMVRGVNNYTPHAFDPEPFPAQDGPPHFYAHGENPQYRHFGQLMRYMQRVCHLINGGLHIAPVAVLYNGEADWVGDVMYEQFPARRLTEGQIDFDIIPGDILAEDQHTLNNGLHVNGETFRALVIPRAEYTTDKVAQFVKKASQMGLPVLFVDAKPTKLADRDVPLGELPGEVVGLEELVPRLRELGICEIRISPAFKDLVYYHYRRDTDLYLFANEATADVFDGWVTIPQSGPVSLYDPWANVMRPLEQSTSADGTRFHLTISPYELAVVVVGEVTQELVAKPVKQGEGTLLAGWQVSSAESKAYPHFTPAYQVDVLESYAAHDPDFSGFLAYETEFDAAAGTLLEIGEAYEGVEVWCNGQYAGMRITPPYLFDLGNLAQPGMNKLRIEVATTLDRKVRKIGVQNRFWMDQPAIDPTGIVGEVRVYQAR